MTLEGSLEINFKEINRKEREGNPLLFSATFACFAV